MAIRLADFKSIINKVLFEFTGTFLLVLCVQLAVGTKAADPPLVIGIIVAVLVYCGGPISGAHINPAVTLGLYLRSSISFQHSVIYIISQVAGAFVGALLGRIIAGVSVLPAIGAGHNFIQAFLAELVGTFLFVFAILSVVPKEGVPSSYYGAAIGLALYVSVACTAAISGGVINPAIAFTLVVIKAPSKLHYALWVCLADALGAIAAAVLFLLLDYGGEDIVEPRSVLTEIREKIMHPKSSAGEAEAAPLISS